VNCQARKLILKGSLFLASSPGRQAKGQKLRKQNHFPTLKTTKKKLGVIRLQEENFEAETSCWGGGGEKSQ